jgi:hypothetical protein
MLLNNHRNLFYQIKFQTDEDGDNEWLFIEKSRYNQKLPDTMNRLTKS